jgi:hypothetical protein
VLADHAVIISSSLWTEQHSNTICDLLRSKTGIHKLVWRTDHRMLLAEYGVGLRENKGVDNIMPPPATAEAPLGSDSEDAKRLEVVIVEEGVKYVANPHGQKSGFYADQRDNRVFLRQCVKGKKVLDLCCYSGGFALNAAMHGAAEVLGVDSAPAAIELAKRNAALNGVLDKCALLLRALACFSLGIRQFQWTGDNVWPEMVACVWILQVLEQSASNGQQAPASSEEGPVVSSPEHTF